MFTIKVFVGQGTKKESIVIKIGKLISMIFLLTMLFLNR